MRHRMSRAGMLAKVVAVSAAAAVTFIYDDSVLASMWFYLREMLAALLLFSIGFAVVTFLIVILFLLDRGLYHGWAWARLCTAHAAGRLHRRWIQVEQLDRKQFHRSGQPVEH